MFYSLLFLILFKKIKKQKNYFDTLVVFSSIRIQLIIERKKFPDVQNYDAHLKWRRFMEILWSSS